MDGFPLFDLIPANLEKVFSKLHSTSYFRLQQTCKGVGKLIRSSPKVSVNLDEYTVQHFWAGGQISYSGRKGVWDESIESLYAVRFKTLRIEKSPELFERHCEQLIKYRITCSELESSLALYNKEQWATLLNILKPIKTHTDCRRSKRFPRRYEAVLESKTVKSANVTLDPEEVDDAIPRLLATFPKVRIGMALFGYGVVPPVRLRLFKQMLEILRSQPISHIRGFIYNLGEMGPALTKEELDRELPEINWVQEPVHWCNGQVRERFWAFINLPCGTVYKVLINNEGFDGDHNQYFMFGPITTANRDLDRRMPLHCFNRELL